MKRFLTGIIAVVIGLAFSTFTYVQAKPGTPATPAVPATPAQGKGIAEKEKEKVEDRTEMAGEKAEKNAEKEKEKAAKRAEKEKGKADKKAAKKHGLDRADEVAGEHGKQGRENAREKQGR
jgi:ABC-type microcin C transport system permease subunit YejB